MTDTPDNVFSSDSVATAISQVSAGHAPPVRRLPAKFGLAGADAGGGRSAPERRRRWNRLGHQRIGPAAGIPQLRRERAPGDGSTRMWPYTTLATIMSEIGRMYEPGASIAAPTSRPSAQVWLVDPRRQLLTTLGTDYVEKFAYNLDGVSAMMEELGRCTGPPRATAGLVGPRAAVPCLVERAGDLPDHRRRAAAAARLRLAAAQGSITVKNQVLVYLVGNHQKVCRHRDLRNGRQFGGAEHRAGRIVG